MEKLEAGAQKGYPRWIVWAEIILSIVLIVAVCVGNAELINMACGGGPEKFYLAGGVAISAMVIMTSLIALGEVIRR